MKRLSLSELYNADYDLKFINCLKQLWRRERSFSCLDAPKRQCLLIYLSDCRAVYAADGKEYVAEAGDVVYCPTGGRYEMRLLDFDDARSYTVGINLKISVDGEESVLSDAPAVFKNPPRAREIFTRILELDGTTDATPANYKSLLFSLFAELSRDSLHRASREYTAIRPGYEYMLSHPYENPSVDFLAGLCFMSSTYFRRLFKAVFSVTPKEMLVMLRLERAKQYLEFSDEPISEIASSLGYYDTSSFIKEFKAHIGSSPLQYRKNNY